MKTITFDPALWQVVPKEPIDVMLIAYQYSWGPTANYKAMLAVAPSPPEVEPVAWEALSDVQWMNIVNHEFAFANRNKEEAVHMAVEMTEEKLRELNHPTTEEIEALRQELETLKDIRKQSVEEGVAGFDALIAENKALRRDAERLDYLQQGSTIDLVGKDLLFRVGGLYSTISPTVREAIDAAMKESKNETT